MDIFRARSQNVERSRLGDYIRSYQEGRGIPFKQKMLTIALLWLTIGFSIGFVATTWWAKALLVVVVVSVTIHLSKIKTWQQESHGSVDQANSMELVEIS